jgi:hypothetical protein
MEGGAATAILVTMLCGAALFVVLGTLIGGLFLRAAIGLYNRMAGGVSSPGSVPVPGFGKAIGIAFLTILATAIVVFVAGWAVNTGFVAAGAGERGFDLLAQVISVPASLLVMAGMLTAMLPTSFGKAVLVTLCFLPLCFLLCFLVFLLITGVGFLPR